MKFQEILKKNALNLSVRHEEKSKWKIVNQFNEAQKRCA